MAVTTTTIRTVLGLDGGRWEGQGHHGRRTVLRDRGRPGAHDVRSRTASEHATCEIEALDGAVGGGKTGDSFAFTVFFDPKEAPLNSAIFGPKATFTGDLIEGEIIIVDPAR